MKTWRIAAGILGAVLAAAPALAQKQQINGAGATFPNPIYSKWFSEYNKLHPDVEINYQSIGSGGGIRQLTNETVFFGASDGPMTNEQLSAAPGKILHLPTVLGGVVPIYNIPGVDVELKFTGKALADIILGRINKWNDPAIAGPNPGVKLPGTDITVVHRSDGSGTTYIFVDYLSKVSPEFRQKVGVATSVNWPAGLGGKGSEGVSGLVKQTPGAIGYVELIYAMQNKMDYAKVKNKKGKFIQPSLASVTAASNITLPDDAKIFLTDTDAADGYPISGFTWVLIYKEQNYSGRSADRAQKLLQLLWWNLHDGQQYTTPLNYAPLSKEALKVAEKIVKSATYD